LALADLTFAFPLGAVRFFALSSAAIPLFTN
jgi:hypothetical protein